MKVLQINATYGSGSTGKICYSVAKLMDKENIENLTLYSQGELKAENAVKIKNKTYYKIQALKSRVFGNYGFNSSSATKVIIRQIKEFSPDIVHLHNIHGHNVNLNTLFTFFKKNPEIKLFWTFHDCWAFTAYCPHYTMAKCYKWQSECSHCKLRKEYSWFFDKSKKLFNRKKELFTGLNLTIVTPSEWLAGEVKKSFMKDYPVKVINNGIDLSVFKPTESDFREKYGIDKDKFLLSGVAFGWGERKGLDVFIELSKRLDKNKYAIVLVGGNAETDKLLPKDIISIHRTQNQTELAEIYSSCDLFVNPTREEVLGLVNIEANACGTPVLTFDSGGSPECINKKSGSVVSCDDINGLIKEIERIRNERPFTKENCILRAEEFDADKKFKEYTELYK
ncbi:MAG: glycosyltransferase [Candidatus Borkfalkiaceae bacterium]|nr:glycosyltransferase [Christensenellaceae bacterium]